MSYQIRPTRLFPPLFSPSFGTVAACGSGLAFNLVISSFAAFNFSSSFLTSCSMFSKSPSLPSKSIRCSERLNIVLPSAETSLWQAGHLILPGYTFVFFTMMLPLSSTHSDLEIDSRAVVFFLRGLDAFAKYRDRILENQLRNFRNVERHLEAREIPDACAIPLLAVNHDRIIEAKLIRFSLLYDSPFLHVLSLENLCNDSSHGYALFPKLCAQKLRIPAYFSTFNFFHSAPFHILNLGPVPHDRKRLTPPYPRRKQNRIPGKENADLETFPFLRSTPSVAKDACKRDNANSRPR